MGLEEAESEGGGVSVCRLLLPRRVRIGSNLLLVILTLFLLLHIYIVNLNETKSKKEAKCLSRPQTCRREKCGFSFEMLFFLKTIMHF